MHEHRVKTTRFVWRNYFFRWRGGRSRRLSDSAEARTDGRLSTMESRVAVMADAAARTEQRERDLNARIAGLAEGLSEPHKKGPGTTGHRLFF